MNGIDVARGAKLRLLGVNVVVSAAVLYSALGAVFGSAAAQPDAADVLTVQAEALAVEQSLSCTVEPRFVDQVIVAHGNVVEVLSFEAAMQAVTAGEAAVLRFCS